VKKCCVPYMFNLERTILPRPKLLVILTFLGA